MAMPVGWYDGRPLYGYGPQSVSLGSNKNRKGYKRHAS